MENRDRGGGGFLFEDQNGRGGFDSLSTGNEPEHGARLAFGTEADIEDVATVPSNGKFLTKFDRMLPIPLTDKVTNEHKVITADCCGSLASNSCNFNSDYAANKLNWNVINFLLYSPSVGREAV